MQSPQVWFIPLNIRLQIGNLPLKFTLLNLTGRSLTSRYVKFNNVGYLCKPASLQAWQHSRSKVLHYVNSCLVVKFSRITILQGLLVVLILGSFILGDLLLPTLVTTILGGQPER